ncbi:sterolin-1-like protein [Encephalitozoon intestinalis]
MKNHHLQLKDVVLVAPGQDMSYNERFDIMIKDVDVEFRSEEIYAFMGTSGSGKTTIMEGISGLFPEESMTSGQILIDNEERDYYKWHSEHSCGRQSGYSIEDLTLDEFIYYTVLFSFPNEDKERINEVIDIVLKDVLNLNDVRHHKMNMLSGGERKRTNIATALIKMLLLEGKLKVVLLDEPTSELDSGLAVKVVRFVKEYARRSGAIVILTVHQPGPELFNLFDSLLFLNRGAKVYAGPPDKFIDFLNTKGIYNSGLSKTNMEFLFSLFTKGSKESQQYETQINNMLREMKEEKEKRRKVKEIKLKVEEDTRISLVPSLSSAILLIKRQLILSGVRSREILLSLAIVLGLSIAIFFAEVNTKTGRQVACIRDLVFLLSLIPFSNAILEKSLHYTREEISKGLYNTATFWLSSVIFEFLMIVIRCTLGLGTLYCFGTIETRNLPFFFTNLILMFFSSCLPRMMIVSVAEPSTGLGKILSFVANLVVPILVTLGIPKVIKNLLLPKEILGFLPQSISSFLELFYETIFYVQKPFRSRIDKFCNLLVESVKEKKEKENIGSIFPMLVMLFISFLIISIISILLLDRRLTPSVRLQLSDDKTKEEKSLKKKFQSLFRGPWLKRFLVSLAMVLGITVVWLILWKYLFGFSRMEEKKPCAG